MKIFPKLSIFFLSVLFVVSGLFIKQKVGKEGPNLPGTVAGQQTNIIKNLYPDIPVYDNAVIVSVLEKSNTVVVTLESTDAPQKVMDYYQSVLAAANWTGGPDDYIKGDKKLSVNVTQNQAKTQTVILLNYSFVPTK